jgi:hypothetical protein
MTGAEASGPYGHHNGGEFSPVKVRTVANWPASTFVENLAMRVRTRARPQACALRHGEWDWARG